MRAADSGWHGWTVRVAPEQEWIDLTHPISPDVPRLEKFAPPRIEKLSSMPEHPNSVTRLEMVCHTGTHLDAPNHFVLGAPAIDEVPLERLHGPATVVHAHAPPGGLIGPSDLDAASPQTGDIVILDTGWWLRPGDGDHPSLSEEAAWWLVKHGIKLLATDLPTPDLAVARRGSAFDWPVHRILLRNGVLIGENLTNLGRLAARAEAMLLPLPIAGADGSPARVLARNTVAG